MSMNLLEKILTVGSLGASAAFIGFMYFKSPKV